jgi:hypothetical protein
MEWFTAGARGRRARTADDHLRRRRRWLVLLWEEHAAVNDRARAGPAAEHGRLASGLLRQAQRRPAAAHGCLGRAAPTSARHPRHWPPGEGEAGPDAARLPLHARGPQGGSMSRTRTSERHRRAGCARATGSRPRDPHAPPDAHAALTAPPRTTCATARALTRSRGARRSRRAVRMTAVGEPARVADAVSASQVRVAPPAGVVVATMSSTSFTCQPARARSEARNPPQRPAHADRKALWRRGTPCARRSRLPPGRSGAGTRGS